MKKVKERDSNFELLRLLAMGIVITSHYNLFSFPQESLPAGFDMNVLLKYIMTAGCIANIVFILLTGYFMIKSKLKPGKIIALLLEMYFYSLIFLGLELLINKSVSKDHLLAGLLPFPFGNWFCVMYMLLMAVSPYVNKLLLSLKKDEYKRFLILLFVIVSIIPTLLNSSQLSRLSLFILIYGIGGYMRLYPSKSSLKKDWLFFFGSLAALVLSVCAIYLAVIITGNDHWVSKITYFSATNTSPLVILFSVALFRMFKRINIGSNKVINYIAGSVLGVYLIHENVFVRSYIWNEYFIIDINTPIIAFIFLSVVKILSVFAACTAIDIIRRVLFGKIESKIVTVLCGINFKKPKAGAIDGGRK